MGKLTGNETTGEASEIISGADASESGKKSEFKQAGGARKSEKVGHPIYNNKKGREQDLSLSEFDESSRAQAGEKTENLQKSDGARPAIEVTRFNGELYVKVDIGKQSFVHQIPENKIIDMSLISCVGCSMKCLKEDLQEGKCENCRNSRASGDSAGAKSVSLTDSNCRPLGNKNRQSGGTNGSAKDNQMEKK